MKRIIIFGTGKYYNNRKHQMPEDVEIVAFIDNNSDIQGQILDGVKVFSPEEVAFFDFDTIVLMSLKSNEMEEQLLELGVPRNKIQTWNRFFAEKNREEYQIYGKKYIKEVRGKNILILSNVLNYTGGPMTALYAAMILKDRGYSVLLYAGSGDSAFIEEIVQHNIPVVIHPLIPYIDQREVSRMHRFDAIIVNVFPMIQCACEISRKKPTLWWIHENSAKYTRYYPKTQSEFSFYDDLDSMKRINIMGVSRIALDNFNNYYPERMKGILPYGIPDMGKSICSAEKKEKLIFAIIGIISLRKAQHIFVKAIQKLRCSERENAEFWIIGAPEQGTYCEQVKDAVSGFPQIKFLGEMTREEMHKAYQKIDVVVCASLEETMSLTITEGMMYGKLCITTDATGMADYIIDGENGFVCKVNDADDLKSKMGHIIRNKDVLNNIGMNARKTYEEYFTLEAFGDRLEAVIEETKREYKHDKDFSNHSSI